MDDLISRQAAIDALADMHCKSDEDGYVWIIRSDAWARIDALPSVQPEKRTEERMETHACDLIDREAAVDAIYHHLPSVSRTRARTMLHEVPSAQPEIIRCKDCKHFELDHFEKVEGFPVPIIVAHEICMKWSDGCRTSKDGWCFMGERRTDEID